MTDRTAEEGHLEGDMEGLVDRLRWLHSRISRAKG